ncbi:superoxide dismutase [Sphingorhabdus sp.]|uniref:superoxide dismutase n=1 Tax=Sphingorhabdus sp. TaxID=1902408 RepID=UPI003593AE09
MFTLPKLPYAEEALEPHISAETVALHHGKHHKGYIDTLNKLLVGDALADLPLKDVIHQSHGLAARQTIFNNAAQSWNHDFFWKSMKPDGGGAPTGDIKMLIEREIGDDAAFRSAFSEAAAKHFGSGWVWLVATDGAVGIVTTHDAELPALNVQTPLLCCDLWEHAYYLDYQNRRADFVTAFLDQLLNWDFANANLAAAASAMNEETPTDVEPNAAPFVIVAS